MLDITPGEAGRGTCRVRILDSQPFGEHESLQPARPVVRNLQDGKCGRKVFMFLLAALFSYLGAICFCCSVLLFLLLSRLGCCGGASACKLVTCLSGLWALCRSLC